MFDFLNLKKSIAAISQKYRELFQERLGVQKEIVSIRNAQTNRADICELAKSWVDRSAVSFTDAISKQFLNAFNNGQTSPVDFGFFALLENEPGGGTVQSLDAAMCGLFGNEIKKCLTDAIMALPWQNEGLPQAERAAKIAKLNEREKNLTDELSKLVKAADEAGIEL
jgi:hypothetical protein